MADGIKPNNTAEPGRWDERYEDDRRMESLARFDGITVTSAQPADLKVREMQFETSREQKILILSRSINKGNKTMVVNKQNKNESI